MGDNIQLEFKCRAEEIKEEERESTEHMKWLYSERVDERENKNILEHFVDGSFYIHTYTCVTWCFI